MRKNRKVVLDTNIMVAAGFNPHSRSAQLLDLIRRGEVGLVWNQATRSETKHVVQQIPPIHWSQIEDLFTPENEFPARVETSPFFAIEDPDDCKFAALAAASASTPPLARLPETLCCCW